MTLQLKNQSFYHINGNTIVTIAGLPLIASLGGMMPPTALAGIFAAKVTPGVESYTSVPKHYAIPMAAISLVEHCTVDSGTLYVIFRANNSTCWYPQL